MKKMLRMLCLFVMMLGCSAKDEHITIIRIKGSDTMNMLTQLLAQRYMRSHPNISIYAEGVGTATGVRALAAGDVDICTASRALLPTETRILAEKHHTVGMANRIALDALCIYSNLDNPVNSITMEQLRDIFACKITDWDAIGGDSGHINTTIRPKNSGTRAYFENMVMEGEKICDNAKVKSTTDSVIFEIFADENAIGYGGYGYHNQIKYMEIDSVAPTMANVKSHAYPIVRYLYFYTINKPEGEVKDFIEWVLSENGQRIIKQAGYIPLF